MTDSFDIVVVGLGHAGTEAALAAARMGCRVAAVTQRFDRAGLMSCNPAIGGPGKSQLVAEVDALGGAMAEAADECGIQFRVLNRSKGPALRATRVQVDRERYAEAIQRRLRAQGGLTLVQGEGEELLLRGGRVEGVRVSDGRRLWAPSVVVTTGTFLAGRLHVGSRIEAGGRAGDAAAEGLSRALREAGLRVGRFKTGTPPRLDGRTIDWSACDAQPSEGDAGPLSARTAPVSHPRLPQRSCHVTWTTPETHEVVRASLPLSPLTTGQLRASGPRYCPSLEHKVMGYPERRRHPVYLEPEGVESPLVYPAGLSTSLPLPIQVALLRTIPGLERVEVLQPGYAVEYDYVPAGQLAGSFEVGDCPGLFLAGQINGSSGYEEAAAQGLVAGANAALAALGRPSWIPDRQGSFLGVLCDDLTRRGFDEPYRVLPARAEARLILREDNAGLRLWRTARDLGVVLEGCWRRAERLEREAAMLEERLDEEQRRTARRPETSVEDFARALGETSPSPAIRAAYLRLRYEPYERQRRVAQGRLEELGALAIPRDLRFESVLGLSREAMGCLAAARPQTLAEAGALSGVTASALTLLAVHLRRRAESRADGCST